MNIPFREFEQYIDETILKRGLDYFKKGLVGELELVGKGMYEAIVDGTEPYVVSLTIENDAIMEYECTCPYDMGPVCKHVVAVLFHLQKEELGIKAKPKKEKAEIQKSGKKKTLAEQVDELLEKLPHEELIEFIRRNCSDDRDFRKEFLAAYAHVVMPESKALYAKQIEAAISSHGDDFGNMHYTGEKLANKANGLINNGLKQFTAGNFQSAFYIATAVLEALSEKLLYLDDSNGNIGATAYASEDLLKNLAKQLLPEKLRKDFFNYTTDAFGNRSFEQWDWHFTMLEIAVDLAKEKDETEQIFKILDRIRPDKSNWNYSFEHAQVIRKALILKTEGEEAEEKYMKENLKNSELRKALIEKLIERKDFAQAIILCNDGIKQDERDKPGLALEWRKYLLKIYVLQQDKVNIQKYARYLFMHTDSNSDLKELYDTFKQNTPPENWQSELQQLRKDVSANQRYYNDNKKFSMYIWENDMSGLLNQLKENPNLFNLDEYGGFLKKYHAEEITDMYIEALKPFIHEANSRNKYKTFCSYLKKLINMGAKAKVDVLVQQVRKLYPHRPALLEELKRVY